MHCCCPGSAHNCGCTPALPQLTETRGAAGSINGALYSLRSQMPSLSSPHAERALCVHNQPLGRIEPGNKTPSLSPGRDWCPPAGVQAGDSSTRQRVKAPGHWASPRAKGHMWALAGVLLAVSCCHSTSGHGTCPHSSCPAHPVPSRNWMRKDRA